MKVLKPPNMKDSHQDEPYHWAPWHTAVATIPNARASHHSCRVESPRHTTEHKYLGVQEYAPFRRLGGGFCVGFWGSGHSKLQQIPPHPRPPHFKPQSLNPIPFVPSFHTAYLVSSCQIPPPWFRCPPPSSAAAWHAAEGLTVEGFGV